MILTAGERRIELMINSPQDAIEFAKNYSMDPAALFDLVNCTVEGDGAQWVRDALKGSLWSLGNSPSDVVAGLINLIRNRDWIVHSPHFLDVAKVDAPVICVASGPSLERHIKELRRLQDRCLIICADTALRGLRENGIYPHIATPLERDPNLKNNVADGYGVTYGGSLYTERSVNQTFANHIVIPADETTGHWVDERRLGYGSSTGTLSVALGLAISSGPVYLVGHDISFGAQSHWTGASCPGGTLADDTCEGNDGTVHQTNHWFKVYGSQIAELAISNQRIYNVNILDQVGALIPGTLPGVLPTELTASFEWKPIQARPSLYRMKLPHRIATLPTDLLRARDIILQAQTVEQLSAEVICGGDNMTIAAALFRSIWSQFSFEKRMGLPPAKVFAGARAAMLSVVNGALPQISEACYAR